MTAHFPSGVQPLSNSYWLTRIHLRPLNNSEDRGRKQRPLRRPRQYLELWFSNWSFVLEIDARGGYNYLHFFFFFGHKLKLWNAKWCKATEADTGRVRFHEDVSDLNAWVLHITQHCLREPKWSPLKESKYLSKCLKRTFRRKMLNFPPK